MTTHEIPADGGKTFKATLQERIRALHLARCKREVPERLAIYGHSMEQTAWEGFQGLVEVLRARGYRFVGPVELLEGPARSVFLSFDDNFRSWYDALPLFEALDVSTTFYVNTEPFRDRAPARVVRDYYGRIRYAGDSTPLTTRELREIHERGHTIGCHTHTHADLGRLSMSEALAEISQSKRELEEIIDAPVDHFAYPYGMRRNSPENLRDACLELGLQTVCNSIPGLQHVGHHPACIQRSPWDFYESAEYNLQNLAVDGRIFERLTGRSAVG